MLSTESRGAEKLTSPNITVGARWEISDVRNGENAGEEIARTDPTETDYWAGAGRDLAF